MNTAAEGDNIVLIGFMGAGKSTVGVELAELTGFSLLDVDQRIVECCGRQIAEIFAQEGEELFRQCETEALHALQAVRRSIVATGGGIVGRQENWELMRRLGPVVYLRCSWPVLRQRLEDASGRPLADGGDWQQVEALWRRRLPLYELADLCVEADQGTPGEIARRILLQLGRGEAQ